MQMVFPLVVQDIRDAYKMGGAGAAIPVGIATTFGVGATTYQKNRKAELTMLRERFRKGDTEGMLKEMLLWNQTNPKDTAFTIEDLWSVPKQAQDTTLLRLQNQYDKLNEEYNKTGGRK